VKENFVLLKQTFPISQIDRKCDGYDFIMKTTTTEERKKLDINENDLQKIIFSGERYLYRVGKENNKFKSISISLKNFEIIRKKMYKFID
jgi:hypothetical protein